jgi:acyl dehydratase
VVGGLGSIPVETVHEYRVVAHNTATTSANKIHDDGVARRYGFRGGLVPGVDVYAYLTHPPAEAWGIDWLRHGSIRARFLAPVYEGEAVTVVPGEVVVSPTGRVVPLELRKDGGALCATGEAGLPHEPEEQPLVATWPTVEPAADPPVASPDVLPPGTALALAAHQFHADRADEYLNDVREHLPLYADTKVAHPGWLLRDANYVLSANVVLGPWIHVESVVQHHTVVHDGDTVDARARVTKEWERKGHRFVEMDVGLFANADRLVARITHTAIYLPRAERG